jgi:hypothetical protein
MKMEDVTEHAVKEAIRAGMLFLTGPKAWGGFTWACLPVDAGVIAMLPFLFSQTPIPVGTKVVRVKTKLSARRIKTALTATMADRFYAPALGANSRPPNVQSSEADPLHPLPLVWCTRKQWQDLWDTKWSSSLEFSRLSSCVLPVALAPDWPVG